MIKVNKLAHVGFHARDLSRQAEFYGDRWGLQTVDEFKGEMFFRAEQPDHHVLTLHEAEAPGMHHVALAVSTPAEVDQAYEELLAAGVEIVNPPSQDLAPGIGRALRFKDPDGFLVELVAGIDQIQDPFHREDVHLQALNHVVLNVSDVDRSEQFYGKTLGFRLTDRFINGLSFWACNANHHSLAFGSTRDGAPSFHHAAFDIPTWEDWMKAVYFAGERGIPRAWGPGRHLFGNNLFSYYKDPEGNTVEYTAEVEQITDHNRQPRVQEPIADQWMTAGRG